MFDNFITNCLYTLLSPSNVKEETTCAFINRGEETLANRPTLSGNIAKVFASLPTNCGILENAFVTLLTNCGRLENAFVTLSQNCGRLAKTFATLPTNCGRLENAFVTLSQNRRRLENAFVTLPPDFGLATTVATLPPNKHPLLSMRVAVPSAIVNYQLSIK
jgi:hypothetical protein